MNFWKSIETYQSILRIIEFGYEIPFLSHTPALHFKYSNSALNHADFVTEYIAELVDSRRVIKVPFKPYIVSPLSVSENKTKLRLILDLSRLNTFVKKKEKIKFEDWKVALNYFEKDSFAVKFDLKSGYHHIDISTKFQTFLGLLWNTTFYCYTVLPFGLTSAPFIFTKCLRPIVKYWRENNINIVLYLDDGLAFANIETKCRDVAQSIQSVFFFFKCRFYGEQRKITGYGMVGCYLDSREFSLFFPFQKDE